MIFNGEKLLDWYDKNKRVLPWRLGRDPYSIWISEIMLQQTRVDSVRGYFQRFKETFPTIEDLANGKEDQVLKAWEGLGYYRRARNLKKAAGVIVEQYGGTMPSTYEDLIKLPGIGPYTAGAIASIAFEREVVAIDGNVLRIVARITMDEGDITKAAMKKRVETHILQVMPGKRPGDFNQALMDLGAMVCIPNGNPHCDFCPLEDDCLAKKEGRIEDFPVKKEKKKKTKEKKTVVILNDKGKMAVEKREEKGLLAGLYQLPNWEGSLTEEQVCQRLGERGIILKNIDRMESKSHVFSHKVWDMVGYYGEVLSRKEETSLLREEPWFEENHEIHWVSKDDREKRYPLPTAFKVFTDYFPK